MKHIFVFDPKIFFNVEWKMDQIMDTIGEYFRTQEESDFAIKYSQYRRNAIGLINEEMEGAKPGDTVRVYAIGGDELLFDCLNGVAHFPNAQLAMIPYGEINDFLRIFGEENIEGFKDITSIVNGEALPTDAIKWGINYALNSCYIGMDSALSKRIKDMKYLGGRSFAALSTFISLLLLSFDKNIYAKEYKIKIDDADYSGRYGMIHIANGPYFSGKIVGVKEVLPDDGLLNITLIRSTHPLGTLGALRNYTKGKHARNCTFLKGKKITIESDSQMWIQLDNEYIQDTNITFNVIPQAINMVAINNLSYPLASISAV